MAERREGHVDLRVVKTREAIREAFREMVCEMPADKITVKGIADRARIHRKTFYLHYTSIEALYEDMFADMAECYAEAIEAIPADMPTEDVNRVFFEHMANLDEFEAARYRSSAWSSSPAGCWRKARTQYGGTERRVRRLPVAASCRAPGTITVDLAFGIGL